MTKNQKKKRALEFGKEYRYNGKTQKGYFFTRTGYKRKAFNSKLNQRITKHCNFA